MRLTTEAGMLAPEGMSQLVPRVPVAIRPIEVPAPCCRTRRTRTDGTGIWCARDSRAAPHKETAITNQTIIVRARIGSRAHVQSPQRGNLCVDIAATERGRGVGRHDCLRRQDLGNRVGALQPRDCHAEVQRGRRESLRRRPLCVAHPDNPHTHWRAVDKGYRRQISWWTEIQRGVRRGIG